MGDKHIGADGTFPSDDGTAAKDGSAGINGHMVLDGGMALLAPEALSAPGGQGTQSDTLIDLHMVADDGGLTHNDAGAMVDEEVFADGGAGMDVDTGDGMGVLRHDPRQHRNAQIVQNVGQPVNGDGEQTRIAENDLIHAVGCRVAGIKGLHIGLGYGTDLGDIPEEGQADFLGLFGSCLLRHLGPQHNGNLLVQIVHHVLDEHGQVVPGVIDPVGLVPGRAGVDDPHQLADHINDDSLIRVLEQIHFVNISAVVVILQNAVDDAFNLLFNGGHGNPSLSDGH